VLFLLAVAFVIGELVHFLSSIELKNAREEATCVDELAVAGQGLRGDAPVDHGEVVANLEEIQCLAVQLSLVEHLADLGAYYGLLDEHLLGVAWSSYLTLHFQSLSEKFYSALPVLRQLAQPYITLRYEVLDLAAVLLRVLDTFVFGVKVNRV